MGAGEGSTPSHCAAVGLKRIHTQMKMVLAIIIASMLAVVAEAQVIYSSIRIPVESGTTCPARDRFFCALLP